MFTAVLYTASGIVAEYQALTLAKLRKVLREGKLISVLDDGYTLTITKED